MVLKNIPVHDARCFTWAKINGEHVASGDASDLGQGPMCGRIYDDACDEGFYVESPNTGYRMLFRLEYERRDNARLPDITCWEFRSVDKIHIKLTVFND